MKTSGYLHAVFSFLLFSPFVSSKKWIWKAVLWHDPLSQKDTMFTCEARSVWVVHPSEQQMDQAGLVQPRLDFCMGRSLFPSKAFLSCEMTELTMLPFFSILMSSQNVLNCRTVSTRTFSQQFSYITQQKQTTKKKPHTNNPHCGLYGITVEYEDKGEMTQCCFYNWFCSTVHSIMVYRNQISANCSSKHEHLACNDSMSVTLSIFSYVSITAAAHQFNPVINSQCSSPPF